MSELIEIEIFGVLTPVDKQEWEDDPQAVIEEVAKNRKILRLDDDDTAEEAERILRELRLEDDDEE